MQAQSAKCVWLVFFDAHTPSDLRARIETHFGYTPVWVDGRFDNARVREYVAQLLPPHWDTLITTRLDNDDAVAVDFLARIQRAAVGEDRLFLNCPFGYQWADGRLYYYLHFANPFMSFVERRRVPGDARVPATVMSGNHEQVRRTGRLRQVWGPPMWLQVIHGGNVINELVGVRRPLRRNPNGFPAIPLTADTWVHRQVDVVSSMTHLARLAWQRRDRLRRRLTTHIGRT
jgi:hypothetical protein